MAATKQSLLSQGFSQVVADRVCASQKQSTRDIYQGKWKKFVDWCTSKDIDPVRVSVQQICDFLSFLFDECALMPATIEVYRTAIAGALNFLQGRDISHDPLISQLFSAMHVERPSSVRTVPAWDLKLVLMALQEPPFEPIKDAEKVPLKFLTWKALFLTLLASGSRRGEVHALTAASFAHDPKWKYVVMKPHEKFVSKTQTRTRGAARLDSVTIKSLADFVGPDLQKDMKLCPVRVLKAYRARTVGMREGKQLFFVSYKPGFKQDICKNTISGWIRKLILFVYRNAGEDTARLAGLRTHDLRGVAATLAYRGGVEVEKILQACSWRSQTTFTEFYLKDICVSREDLNSLGPLSVAQSVITP